jgi:hypothetical protein
MNIYHPAIAVADGAFRDGSLLFYQSLLVVGKVFSFASFLVLRLAKFVEKDSL